MSRIGPRKLKATKRTRGFILVVALVIIAGLLALMAMLVSDQREAGQATLNRLRESRAQAAADAGVQRAMALLDPSNSNSAGGTVTNPNLVTLNDGWAQIGSTGAEEYDLTGTTFRMGIVDAGSLINLNMPSQTTLQTMLQQLPLDSEHIDSLLDWLQSGETARSDGAKDTFYNALPQPYNAELGPINTVDELLLVNDWTAADLYQPPTTVSTTVPLPTDTDGNTLPLAALFTADSGSPNTQATGSARINFSTPQTAAALRRAGLNQGLINILIPGRPPFQPPGTGSTGRYTSFATLFALRGMSLTNMQTLLNIADFSTSTRSVGKINLNTATAPVLETIPGMTSAMASSIVSQQGTGFQTLGALTTVAGMTPALVRQMADYLTIGSDTWIVRVYGEDQGIGCSEEAVVGIRNGAIKIVTLEKLNIPGIPEWWNWTTQTTSEDAGVTT